MKDIPRERLLLGGIVLLVTLPILFFVYRSVSAAFATRQATIAGLEKDVKTYKDYNFAGERAKKKVGEYLARSLPADPVTTRREYQNWLIIQVEKAGLHEPKVDFKSQTSSGELYVMQEFTVHVKGGLPQFVELLHAFYSQDWLHRITRVSLRPIKNSKLLDVNLTVDALSLKKAKDTPQLVPRAAKRLELASSKAYYETIVGRNLFGPANNPPKLSISGNKDVYLGRNADLTAKGSDTDPLDKMTYRLVEASDPSAKLDAESGKFSWRPPAIGKYEFAIEAIDDGYPARPSKVEKFVINVAEQPPPKGPDRPQDPPPSFDHSRFTVFTAVLNADGQGEVWLHNRPTGEMIKLHRGDKFQIGTVKGTVADFGTYDFSFDSGGKRLKVAHGDILFNAKVVGDTPMAAPPAEAEAGAEPKATVETSAPAAPKPAESKPAPPAPENGKAEQPKAEAENGPAPAPPEAGDSGQ